MRRKFFLIGMPGAGKTTWGQRWATLHDLPFYDTDDLLRVETGKSISAIFKEHGKEAFRLAEKKVLDVVLRLEVDAVIACGGGTPMYFDNLERMLTGGCVIYLQAKTELLLPRILNEPDRRPLLQNDNPEKILETLLADREQVYLKAHLIVEAANLTDATFAEILQQCTSRP